ncbi:MAG: hypothetical protein K6F77_10335 [Lachnospiraceae bacterium]|nr:hypothetical protein [Lachnospiraceae bacterium]
MRGFFGKKMMSLVLSTGVVVSSLAGLTACGGGGAGGNETVTLTVYSQLANYSGEQIGWSADILKEKFNVKVNIIPEGSGVYQTRMESGDLGDIVVFGSADNYKQAVTKNLLYDWESQDLLHNFGPYIEENMQDALNWNKELTKKYTDGASDALYGIGNSIATSSEDHQSFFYTWDTRWDLYKELGYPEVKNMEDMGTLLKQMQGLQKKDEAGNKTYAVSLWPDWDGDMVMYVKSTATAYYGYDELGIGVYDPTTGDYHDCLRKDGVYLEMLKWYNGLYQNGLVDPDSMTQNYDNMAEKARNGGVLFSIFNYSGSLQYNTDAHLKEGKMMYSMRPTEAQPIVYGMSTTGSDWNWCIGAQSKYPDKAMEVINYLATPEGTLTMQYGPKGECWDYDEEGNTYFTDHGKDCQNDKTGTTMGGGHEGSYHDGELQINNTIWALDSKNPESNGENYNQESWKSNVTDAQYEIQQDWRDKTGVSTLNEYFEGGKFRVMPAINYVETSKDDELKTTWKQVTGAITSGSWKAMYSKTDAEYDKVVAQMIKEADSYGYDDCLAWSQGEADQKTDLISQLKN